MPDFARCGMSMRTPAGSVDLVPLFRRLEGDKDAPVAADERDAGVLALTHLGVGVHQIHKALNMGHADVRDVLAKHGMEPVESAEPEPIAWTGVAYKSTNATRRAKRKAERNLVDGRLVHPEAPHGTDRAYTDFGCQCVPCTAAHAASLAEYRAKRARAAS
jgi:hypothetical protein